MNYFLRILLLACLFSITPFTIGALAQNIDGFQGLSAQQSGPIKIEADKLEVFENKSESLFSGNVVLVQKQFKLVANSLSVFYGTGGPSELSKAIAKGSVRIDYNGQIVTGQNAIYDPNKEIFRVSGNVTLTQGSSKVTGSELVIDLVTGNADIKANNNGRVSGTFEAPSN